MKKSRSHKIRLVPNNKQITYFKKACGTSRFVWNWALERWLGLYRKGNKPSGFSLKKEFNSVKREKFSWVFDVTKCAAEQSFTDLQTAYKRFFKGLGNKPCFKKRGVKDSFYLSNDQFALEENKVRVPKLGWVKMREPLRFSGKIMSATISRRADQWYASIQVDFEISTPAVSENQAAVGVDLGVHDLAILSTGEKVTGPKPHKALLRRLRFLNKSLSRKKKGSKNFEKAKLKLGRLHLRISNIRNDCLHKLTFRLTKEFGIIGIENLNVKGMVKNHKLARSILDMGFYEFKRQLNYKSKVTGSTVVEADRFFPSTKLCSVCGYKNKDLTLSDREWQCPICGTVHDRDTNSGINLREMAVGSTVTACRQESSGSGNISGTKLCLEEAGIKHHKIMEKF